MEAIAEKFNKFSHMVMKEAEDKKKEIIVQAEALHQKTIETKEIDYLKEAYEIIQNAVRKIDKSINEEVSKAIVESKQALFNKRDEIIESVFRNVKERLLAYKKAHEYRVFLENQFKMGLSKVGQGDILVLVDEDDFKVMRQIADDAGLNVEIEESEAFLLGGCIVVNKLKGVMNDGSLISRFNEERKSFLSNYGLSIE